MIKILLMLILVLLVLILAATSFTVGFSMGSKETKRYKKATQGEKTHYNAQKVREEKAKREWKKFLNYDGSSNADVVE